MKKVLVVSLVAAFVFACAGKKVGHDLRENLGVAKTTIVKSLGEPVTSEPYGGTTRISYEGEFSGVKGTWSYYVLNSDDTIVSTEFTAKGQHQPVFLEALKPVFGEPLTLEAMTADIPKDDVMGAMFVEQIKQRHDAGMRNWRDDKKGVSYALDVVPEGNGDTFATIILAMDDKKLKSIEQQQAAAASAPAPAATTENPAPAAGQTAPAAK